MPSFSLRMSVCPEKTCLTCLQMLPRMEATQQKLKVASEIVSLQWLINFSLVVSVYPACPKVLLYYSGNALRSRQLYSHATQTDKTNNYVVPENIHTHTEGFWFEPPPPPLWKFQFSFLLSFKNVGFFYWF